MTAAAEGRNVPEICRNLFPFFSVFRLLCYRFDSVSDCLLLGTS